MTVEKRRQMTIREIEEAQHKIAAEMVAMKVVMDYVRKTIEKMKLEPRVRGDEEDA